MRKWIGAGVVVLLIAGAGYLGAQAYSSQRFEDEMARLVARLDASPQWRVSRHEVDSGWFHSSGRIEAHYLDLAEGADAIVIDTPYHAEHGLLETTLGGESQVRIGDDDETLFGDVLKSDAPVTWKGRFLTRDQRLEASVEVPGFSQRVTVPASGIEGEMTPPGEIRLDFDGLSLDIVQVDDRVTLDGQAPRLQMADDEADVRLDGMALAGTFKGDDRAFEQQLTLTIPTATVTPSDGPSVVSKDIRYAMRATLDAEQLAMQLKADVGESRIQGQRIFSGSLNMTLDRIDGDAYRALAANLDSHLGAIQAAIDANDEAALDAALAPLEPQIQAMLAGSPRLALDTLDVDSPLLGMQMNGSGELTLDGAGIENWNPGAMSDQATANALIERLEGHLILNGAPLLLSMYLGLPTTSDPLRVELADGVLDINGRRMPLLLPELAE